MMTYKTTIYACGLWFSVNAFSAQKAQIIDVRTQEEWNDKHLPSSKLIDFKAENFKSEISKLDRTKEYEVFCRSGSRSGNAVQIMKEQGFTKVKNLGSLEDASRITGLKCQGPKCS